YKLAIIAQHIQHLLAHPRHDAHVHHNVGRVGDLHANVSDVRADGAHAERNHIHCPSAHTAVEQRVQLRLHLVGSHPVVGRSRILATAAADVGAVFDACNVTGV